EDGGRTWANLTAFKTESVIGSAQTSVAASISNPGHIVVANQFGVWRSLDGGLSWTGLNLSLPNLPVKRILSTPEGATGTRIEVAGIGAAELAPGASVWTPIRDATFELDAVTLKYYASQTGADVRSIARSGTYVYLGTANGQILISNDGG